MHATGLHGMSDYILYSSHFPLAGTIRVELSLSQLCHPELVHPIIIICTSIKYCYLIICQFVCPNNIIISSDIITLYSRV